MSIFYEAIFQISDEVAEILKLDRFLLFLHTRKRYEQTATLATIAGFLIERLRMLHIFLKDRQQTVKFTDYPSTDPIKFMMNFKKIFPSTFDLLLPVLPEDTTDLKEVTWESTFEDLKIFERLIQEWATVELRLSALRKMKTEQLANDLVRKAQAARKQYQNKQVKLNLLEADYIFLQTVHSLLDIELVEIGAAFYLPILRKNWQDVIPAAVLNIAVESENK